MDEPWKPIDAPSHRWCRRVVAVVPWYFVVTLLPVGCGRFVPAEHVAWLALALCASLGLFVATSCGNVDLDRNESQGGPVSATVVRMPSRQSLTVFFIVAGLTFPGFVNFLPYLVTQLTGSHGYRSMEAIGPKYIPRCRGVRFRGVINDLVGCRAPLEGLRLQVEAGDRILLKGRTSMFGTIVDEAHIDDRAHEP